MKLSQTDDEYTLEMDFCLKEKKKTMLYTNILGCKDYCMAYVLGKVGRI